MSGHPRQPSVGRSLLWFLPPAIVIGSGVWASLSGTALVSDINDRGREWSDAHAASTGTMTQTDLGEVGLSIGSEQDAAGRWHLTSASQRLLAAGDSVERPITMTNNTTGPVDMVRMRTDAADPNELARALHVGIRVCDEPWAAPASDSAGYVCPAGNDQTVVGNVPLLSSDISVSHGSALPAGADLHLLLTFNVPEETENLAQGQVADLNIRFIGA